MCAAGKDFSLASVGEGKENQIKVNWGRWINKDNETLFDLIFGCIVYSIVFEVIDFLSWRIKAATVWDFCLEQL